MIALAVFAGVFIIGGVVSYALFTGIGYLRSL